MHVCRRWRNVVFASPRGLNLQLFCTHKTPTRETLDNWPVLPIIVFANARVVVPNVVTRESLMEGADNIIAALEHNERVFRITFKDVPSLLWERSIALMQAPFPALTYLELWSVNEIDETALVLPESFLGGCVPGLQSLELGGIRFPALRKLLLSANDLVNLDLWDIPNSGYISPKAMVTSLSTLTKLETLHLGFRSPLSRPDQTGHRLPPLTRILLPVLTSLWFRGVSEYLEDLVSQIDAPLLDDVIITFFNQLVFDTPQLLRFVSRTESLK